MEENILIKSTPSKKVKFFIIGVAILMLIISIIFLIVWVKTWIDTWNDQGWIIVHNINGEWYGYQCCEICGFGFGYPPATVKNHILEEHIPEMTLAEKWKFGGRISFFDLDYETLSRLHWIFLSLAGIVLLIWILMSHCSLTVTDKNVSGKTFLGKKVVLPIDKISAYSTSRIFCIIAVTSASGHVRFPCVGNYKEIANVLQGILNERQIKTKNDEKEMETAKVENNLEDLLKLKNCLDAGIITQEEFDAKKKEILGI